MNVHHRKAAECRETIKTLKAQIKVTSKAVAAAQVIVEEHKRREFELRSTERVLKMNEKLAKRRIGDESNSQS